MATLKSSLVVSLNDRMSGPARGVVRSIAMMKHEARGFARGQMAMGAGLFSGLRGVMALGAGYIGLREGISGTIGAAIKFEDAMSDIRKVVDFNSPVEFKKMGDDIMNLSKRIPMAADGLAAITAAAGQANIAKKDLLPFTEMAAKTAVAWDMSAGDVGDSLAKIKTAMGYSVKETGLYADAINYLSNTSAASAPNLVAFSRGLPSAKQAGFSGPEFAAFGAAMIGSGFQAEVAETSFRNMAKALTAGAGASKPVKKAFKTLGLDSRKVSRQMQKDAVGTTLEVFERLNQLPKHQQGAVATALFGAEARALPALLGNLPELKRLLSGVADEINYAGSASKEYEQASKRTSNALALLKNNVSALGTSIGDKALPKINEWALTLADTLLTIDSRVTVFDKLGAGVKGFMTGLGFDGSTAGEQFGKLYDAVFGRLDTFESDTDRLGSIFLQFREWGASVRDFGSAVSESIGDIERFFNLDPGTIGETIGSLSGMGLKLTLGAIGIGIAAKAVGGLARSIMFLSGASTLIGGAKGIVKILGAVAGFGGGKLATTAGSAAAGAGTAGAAGAATSWGSKFGSIFKFGEQTGFFSKMLGGAGNLAKGGVRLAGKAAGPIGAVLSVYDAVSDIPTAGLQSAQKHNPNLAVERDNYYRQFHGVQFEGGMHRAWRDAGPKPRQADSALGGFAKQGQSSGVQQVQVMNQPVPNINVTVNAPITVNEASDAAAIAGRLGGELKSRMDGLMADLEHAAGQ